MRIIYIDNGNTERGCDQDYSTHTCHCVAEVKFPYPFANRKFSGSQTWKKGWKNNPNAYVIATHPDKVKVDELNGVEDDPDGGVILGTTTAMVILEPLATRVTRVTQVQQSDLKIPGSVGDMISNAGAKYSLNTLDQLHYQYQRAGTVVDAEVRKKFIDEIHGVRLLTAPQLLLVKKCMNLETDFITDNGFETKKLKSKSAFVEMSMKINTTSLGRPMAAGKYQPSSIPVQLIILPASGITAAV